MWHMYMCTMSCMLMIHGSCMTCSCSWFHDDMLMLMWQSLMTCSCSWFHAHEHTWTWHDLVTHEHGSSFVLRVTCHINRVHVHVSCSCSSIMSMLHTSMLMSNADTHTHTHAHAMSCQTNRKASCPPWGISDYPVAINVFMFMYRQNQTDRQTDRTDTKSPRDPG